MQSQRFLPDTVELCQDFRLHTALQGSKNAIRSKCLCKGVAGHKGPRTAQATYLDHRDHRIYIISLEFGTIHYTLDIIHSGAMLQCSLESVQVKSRVQSPEKKRFYEVALSSDAKTFLQFWSVSLDVLTITFPSPGFKPFSVRIPVKMQRPIQILWENTRLNRCVICYPVDEQLIYDIRSELRFGTFQLIMLQP